MGIHFIYPQFLLLLFILPVFVIIYFSSFFYKKKKAINFPNFEAMQRIFGVEIFSRNFVSLYINLFVLILIIFSISGTILTYQGRASFVLAIDNSESMRTADVLPSRLEAAKSAAKDFANSLDGSELAIIEFSGKATVLQEPDTSKLNSNLIIDNIQPTGTFGTDFEEVLYSTNFLLENRDKKYLVVLSDGQINFADINSSINYAKDNNIIVSTIAIGTTIGGLTESGTISRLDEYSLQKIAFSTGGQYALAEDSSAIEQHFKEILADSTTQVSLDITHYLLLVALFLFVIVWVIQNFRFKSIP